MKRAVFFLSVLLISLFAYFISGCETTPLEECEQEEICKGKTVTACCNEIECYYEYNGKKYGTDAESLLQLATDLGCTYAGMINYEEEIKDIVLRIEALGEIAKTHIKE